MSTRQAIVARRLALKQARTLDGNGERLAATLFERAFETMARARQGLPSDATRHMSWRINRGVFDGLSMSSARIAGARPMRQLGTRVDAAWVLFGLPVEVVEDNCGVSLVIRT